LQANRSSNQQDLYLQYADLYGFAYDRSLVKLLLECCFFYINDFKKITDIWINYEWYKLSLQFTPYLSDSLIYTKTYIMKFGHFDDKNRSMLLIIHVPHGPGSIISETRIFSRWYQIQAVVILFIRMQNSAVNALSLQQRSDG